MSLPRIASYALPARDELPGNRVDWPLEPRRAVVLVHDMQNHFVDAYAERDGVIGQVVANIARTTGLARSLGVPVVFTAQPPAQEPADRGLLTDFWGEGLQTRAGARIVDALAPHAGDTVLTKWRYNAFLRTPLRDLLRDSGRDQLVVTGVYAHIGCLLTAADAFMHDTQAFFVADAVADFSREEHLTAVRYAASRCARVLGVQDVLAEFSGARPAVAR
ncbi:isochorismatase family protein [Kineococcus sp. SYSU DK001]|uniref:isochorismatase family protein n=1 Tax=Kineococcus sp. SYSU DK001 TaxID=3383122 RepID=UPI003D7DB298